MCVLWPQWKHCLRQLLQGQVAGSPTWSLKHLPVKEFHLPVKVFPFPVSYICSLQWLCCVLRGCVSTRRPNDPEGPWGALAVVLKAMQWLLFRAWQFCHFFMNFTAASIKGGTPCTQKPSVPRVAFLYLLGTDPGLLGWQLVALQPPGLAFTAVTCLSLSTVLTRSTLKTVFIKFSSQTKQQRGVPCCLIFGPTQDRASLHWLVSKPS